MVFFSENLQFPALYWLIVLLVTRQVHCVEFSRCYDDVNICLWTNGTQRTFNDAEEFCRQRNNSFLPRVTDDNIQSKLQLFRRDAITVLSESGFWIDVVTTGVQSVHWVDGSPLAAGGRVENQEGGENRYIVITRNNGQFVYSARQWNDQQTSSYICQTTGAGCTSSGEWWTRSSQTSTCYMKVETDSAVTWFSASNDCLSRGGLLAIFSDLGRPSDDLQLVQWINNTQTSDTYWIGFTRSWWIITDVDGGTVDVQYSNWMSGHLSSSSNTGQCVVVTAQNEWITWSCSDNQIVVCQNYTPPTTTSTTSTATNSLSDSVSVSSSSSSTSTTTTPSTATVITSSSIDTVAIGVGVGVGGGVIIILIILIIIIVVCKKRRATAGDGRSSNAARDDHALKPIDAYESQPVVYATVVQPDVTMTSSDVAGRRDDVTEEQQPGPDHVVYSELTSTSPVVTIA